MLIAGGLILSNAFNLSRLIRSSADICSLAIFILSAITTIAPLVIATAIGLLGEANYPSHRSKVTLPLTAKRLNVLTAEDRKGARMSRGRQD